MSRNLILVLTFLLGLILKMSHAAASDVPVTVTETASTHALATSVQATPVQAAPATINHFHIQQVPVSSASMATAVRPSAMAHEPQSLAFAPSVPAATITSAQSPSSLKVSLAPIVGISQYQAGWFGVAVNEYTYGLLIDTPITDLLSLETEGTYGAYSTRYQHAGYPEHGHRFNQYALNANLKVYLLNGSLRPFVGGGIGALYYQNMDLGPAYGPFPPQYDYWLGAGQIFAGAELALSQNVAIGARATLLRALYNRPITCDNGYSSGMGCEDASLMNTDIVRWLGTVKVSL